MLRLTCRCRVGHDSGFLPVKQAIQGAIMPSQWEFRLEWTEMSTPVLLTVDTLPIKRSTLDIQPDQSATGAWCFTLPPHVHGTARIEAEAANRERVTEIVELRDGYTLPEQQVLFFLDWIKLYRQVFKEYSDAGQIDVLLLIEGLDTYRVKDNSGLLRKDISPQTQRHISDLLGNILKSPLRRLSDEHQLVDPGEIRRISPSTIDYFIRHPETWQSRSHLQPRPLQLLDERSEEDFNVYENRFVLYFLLVLEKRLLGILAHDRSVLDALQVKLPESKLRASYGLMDTGQDEIQLLLEQQQKASGAVHDTEQFLNIIRRVRSDPMFEDVLPLTGPPRANTALTLHPSYGSLFRLYQQIDLEEFNHQRVRSLDEARQSSLHSAYRAFCYLLVLRVLKEHPFALQASAAARLPVFQTENVSAAARGPASSGSWLTFEHVLARAAQVTVEIVQNLDEPLLDGAIHVTFSYSADKTAEMHLSHAWLVPDITWWGNLDTDSAEKELAGRRLYEACLRTVSKVSPVRELTVHHRRSRPTETPKPPERHSIFILHPTPPTLLDDRLDYSGARLFFNFGDNFVDESDYQRYGGYKIGFLPIYPSTAESEELSLERLRHLMRIHLFDLGLVNVCWNCGHVAKGLLTNGLWRYRCQNSQCRLQWGEVQCSCGHKYFKTKAPTRGNKDFKDIMGTVSSPHDYIVMSEALAGRLAISSPCEDLDRLDDFWAICPYCGHCEKENKSQSCLRCRSRREAKNLKSSVESDLK